MTYSRLGHHVNFSFPPVFSDMALCVSWLSGEIISSIFMVLLHWSSKASVCPGLCGVLSCSERGLLAVIRAKNTHTHTHIHTQGEGEREREAIEVTVHVDGIMLSYLWDGK